MLHWSVTRGHVETTQHCLSAVLTLSCVRLMARRCCTSFLVFAIVAEKPDTKLRGFWCNTELM